MLRLAILLLSFLITSTPAVAQEYQNLIEHPVRICDADQRTNSPPDFAETNCRSALFYEADPQGQMLWIELLFDAQPTLLEDRQPLGLFLSAKASSEAILNGVSIGSNGRPGISQLSEEAGDMDSVFFVPEGTLLEGQNRLVMRMSSMNGEITLASPIHNLVLAPYRDPRQPGPATWFALITFGLFVASFVFFGVRSLRGNDRQGAALIAVLSFMAALQLAVEAARDIMPYPYPLHDVRLTLILTFAIGLGLSFVAYVLHLLFKPYLRYRMLALSALLIMMLLIGSFVGGFDLKTICVLIAASLAVVSSGILAFLHGNRIGAWYGLAGALLSFLIFWLGGFFLDTVLYLIVAAGLLVLLFKHARGSDIEGPLQVVSQEPKRIELTSSGKVEFVDLRDIARFSGAGDYVEVFLRDGRSALHNASLSALEADLSEGFIRVHRSHIVNAAFVKALMRESAGTGQLQMLDGSEVPVSRRNMARVRNELSQD